MTDHITDPLDVAANVEQAERDRNIAAASALANRPIPVEYVCRQCGEPTIGARWCSQTCCFDWTLAQLDKPCA